MNNCRCIFLSVFLLPGGLSAEEVSNNDINNKGSCNVNVQGSVNNATVNCSPNESPQASSVLVVVSSDSQWGVVRFWDYDPYGSFQPFYFQAGIIDFFNSTISVEIDRYGFFGYLNEDFEGGNITVNVGAYPFVMEASFALSNGFHHDVRCNGIINIQSSAQIIPYFNIRVDQSTQQIRRMDCGFMANPV